MKLEVYMNFHCEDRIAASSINSLMECIQIARHAGMDVEPYAVLDKASVITTEVVNSYDYFWTEILVLDLGDLGAVRQHLADQSHSEMIGFFDGDDLFGSAWISRAFAFALSTDETNFVLHPEWLYYFHSSESVNVSQSHFEIQSYKNFFMQHVENIDSVFRQEVFGFNNPYSSNIICPTRLFQSFKYVHVEDESGRGIEDWSWNAETSWAGVQHIVIPDTVHLVRVKEVGSLGTQNASRNLLPNLNFHNMRRAVSAQNASEVIRTA